MDLRHAADIVDDAANFLTTDQILPCDEGTAVAESLGTLGMNLRELAKSPLIAAAPELLEALEALLNYANRYSEAMLKIGRGAEQLGDGADSESVAAQARRAIAKAKGVTT